MGPSRHTRRATSERWTNSIVGVDLSGPTNVADTAVAAFANKGDSLELITLEQGVSDPDLLELVAALPAPVAVGLDAPLSYQPGGGQRQADADLRRAAVAAGLRPGSIMAPTMTRMAYLTLRGIAVARLLSCSSPAAIVEVHPGACMALRDAPIESVRSFKQSRDHQQALIEWLGQQRLGDLSAHDVSDHRVAACAAALAAWKWTLDQSVWKQPADPPHHPFDYAV